MDRPPESSSLKGRLLVATPHLVDPNFFRTVVLLVEHNEEGAAGVVLNRPSEMELDDSPLDGWQDVAADPALVFVGGPAQPTAAVCLARAAPLSEPPGWKAVVGGLGVLDLEGEKDEVRRGVDRLRVF